MIAQHVSLNRALRVAKENGGFLSASTLEIIAHHDRLRPVLVRCGNGRFTCAAQDAKHFMDIIARDAAAHGPVDPISDHVRDVSLPTTDPIWQ